MSRLPMAAPAPARRKIPVRIVAFCAGAWIAAAPAAFAHASLKHAKPAIGSTVHAPTALHLIFTERVEPLFSKVTIESATGKPVKVGPLHSAEDGQELTLKLPELSPGTYTVVWHVTSVDTHKTHGRFQFMVSAGS